MNAQVHRGRDVDLQAQMGCCVPKSRTTGNGWQTLEAEDTYNALPKPPGGTTPAHTWTADLQPPELG